MHGPDATPEELTRDLNVLANVQQLRPRSPRHLWQLVLILFGVRIPYARCCPGHASPFEAFAHAFFARSSICVWHASRGFGGKSFLLALLSLTEQVLLGASVALLGGSLEQSKRVLSYLTGADPNAKGKFWGAPLAPRWLQSGDPTQTETRLINGGWLKALAASHKSARGPHPQRLRLDECLAGWTQVLTRRGWVRIEEVSAGDSVYGWDRARLRWGWVSRSFTTGIKPTLSIHLSNGRVVTCTANHPLLTQEGWKRADAVEVGQALLGVRISDGRSSEIQDRQMPDVLDQGAKRRQGPAAEVRGLRGKGGAAFDDLPAVLHEATRRKGSPVRGLRQEAQRWRRTVPGVLASSLVGSREGAADAGSKSDRVEVERPHIEGRSRDDGTPGSLRIPVSAFSSDARLDRRLRVAWHEDYHRGSRGLLARQGISEGSRPEEEGPIGGRWLDGSVYEDGPDASLVRVVAIVVGPTVRTYDLTVPGLASFVAEGVVVHNCDEMDLGIFDSAMGQTMAYAGVPAQTVCSSTHQYPDGTMTEILKRAAEKGWPVFHWCYQESMAPPAGWLDPAEVERKRNEVTSLMWETEYELQEPSVEGRAIDAEAVRDLFDERLGVYPGTPGKQIVRIKPGGDREFYHGADWAKAKDWSVLHSMWANPKGPDVLAAWCRVGRIPWPQIIKLFNDRVERYGGPSCHDATGVGEVCADYLEIDSEGVDFRLKKQRDEMLSNYIAAIERREMKYPKIAALETEHKYATWADVYGSGHLPDSISAGALAQRAKMLEVGHELLVGRA